MLKRTVRRLTVAAALVATAGVGITVASAAGTLGARHAGSPPAPIVQRQALPVVSGDLGEVIVRAPGELGEVVVRAPGELGEVLVSVARLPAAGQLMADVVVSAPRVRARDLAPDMNTAAAPAMMAASR
jgi:hypothetical protein